MRTLAEACNNTPLELDDELPNGDRLVHAQIDGVYRCIGVMKAPASQATLEASPGIQGWSHPRGKVSVRLDDPGSVANFAEHWERHWRRTYPLSGGSHD